MSCGRNKQDLLMRGWMYLSIVFLRHHFMQSVCHLMVIARPCMGCQLWNSAYEYNFKRLQNFMPIMMLLEFYCMYVDGPVLLHCLYHTVLLCLLLSVPISLFFPNHHHHHNRFMALFLGPPGWAGARREILDFMVQAKINRGRLTDHPAGCHSIRTNECPPPPSPHIFYRPDALPAAQPTASKHWRQYFFIFP